MRAPTQRELAYRDPALGALMGITPVGGNFGHESRHSADFGWEPTYDFGWEPKVSFGGYPHTFGADSFDRDMFNDPALLYGPSHPAGLSGPHMGADFGDDMGYEMSGEVYGDMFGDYGYDAHAGADFGLATRPQAPPPQVAMALWQRERMRRAKTARRVGLLEPNKGSLAKVEGYGLAVNQTITIGTAVALTMTQNPDCYIRPRKVTSNAPTVAFATISEIKVGNVSGTIGGVQDAFDYSALAVQALLDLPTISPATRVTVLGGYTGLIPPPFVGGAAFPFAMSFKGPASMVQ